MSHFERITVGRFLVAAVFLLAATVPVSHAQTLESQYRRWLTCDVVWGLTDAHHTGSSFRVKISFRGEPISGVQVSLTRVIPPEDGSGNLVLATGETDSDGIARFIALPPGSYNAHVNGLLAPSEQIEVDAGDAPPDRVEMEWPPDPIETRNLRGWVRSWQKSSPQNRSDLEPLENVLVQALDLRSGDLLWSTLTDSDGYYEFPGAINGLYALRVNEYREPSATAFDKAVLVSASAAEALMPTLEFDKGCEVLEVVREGQ